MSLILSEDYKLNKIIFVNSGRAAYVELPMHATGALFGDNNEGKTSGLSALKLFILPETNFKDCERKFSFQSGGTAYRADQSANYYFPADNSFVICEAENPKGTFCMVLHRSKEEWGYARIAIAQPYDAIRHLFWDFEATDKNHGFGAQWPQLELQNTIKALKKMGGKVLRTRQEIREAIYSRVSVIDDLSRFCLIPLIQKGERGSVEALRSLLSLAFDIKGGAKTSLPKALATIIEGENASQDGGMAIEIGAITTEYQQLTQRTAQLDQISEALPLWQGLKDAHATVTHSRIQLAQQLPLLVASIQHQQQLYLAQHSEYQVQLEDANEALNIAQQIVQNTQTANIEAQKTRQLRQSDYDLLAKKLGSIAGLYDHYHVDGDDSAALEQRLKQLLEQAKTQIASLSDRDSALQRLEQLNRNIHSLQQQRQQLQLSLEQTLEHSLTAVDEHTAQVLRSLNGAFNNLSQDLSDEMRAAFTQFAQCFEIQDQQLRLAEEVLPGVVVRAASNDVGQQQAQSHIENLTAQLQELETERSAIAEVLDINQSDSAKDQQLSELKAAETALEKDLKLLNQKDYTQDQLEAVGEQLEALTPDIELKQEAQSNAIEALQSAQDERNRRANELETLLPRKQELDRLQQSVKDASMASGLTVPNVNTEREDVLEDYELKQYVDDYHTMAQNLPKQTAAVRDALRAMLQHDIDGLDSQLIYKGDISDADISQCIEALSAEFENLEANLRQHKNDIRAHNHETSIRVSLLERVANTIDQFKAQINQSLAQYPISNLSSIALELSVDPRFNSLRNDMESFEFESDTLNSAQFYERLNSFCDDFFQGGTSAGRRIQLDKIITGVEYHYEIDGRLEKASQSNGTNCMISTVLLAILLKRLVPDMTQMQFPIVFDEAGSLDAKNLKTIKNVVEDHGFVLFIANPTNNGVIASVIEHWYDLSMYRITEGQIVGKCSVVHYEMAEGLVANDAAPVAETA